MYYEAIPLSGSWKMDYTERNYTSQELPRVNWLSVADAVPGYWEDMELLRALPFSEPLKINPAYRPQAYPMEGYCPDMLLPNIVGCFFYQKSFNVPDVSRPAVIHFGGVQSAVSVWLGDRFIGRHEGYSAPFDIEIPEGALKTGENTLTLAVSNHTLSGFDSQPISGITSRAASEYSGGLTDGVELRFYTSLLREVALTVEEDCKSLSIVICAEGNPHVRYTVYDGERPIKEGEADGSFTVDSSDMERWSPERPKLYRIRVSEGEAYIERDFGVRKLTADGPRLLLNGEPYYLRGVCEHCYYPETVHPTHDEAFYREVIRRLKSLGFNFIRFHTHVPPEEYMRAADELGILVQVESPNNTTAEQWRDIVSFCSRHTSTVIYCCGNELQLYDDFIEYLADFAGEVHKKTDALFSPMSALRGLEYHWREEGIGERTLDTPFRHCPDRFDTVGRFADLYNSYSLGHFSYDSIDADPHLVSEWHSVYKKPRVTHEICIDGTYTDLSLKKRYEGTRIGKTGMLDSIERHLKDKGILQNAPLYFKNSAEWQRRVRKHCFESVRLCENMAGYDFLGPIDTHWHTFGYDVGMMNEFYELKPGESLRGVRMYNSDAVLLTSLGTRASFTSGERLACEVLLSAFCVNDTDNATLEISLSCDGECIESRSVNVEKIINGTLSKLCNFEKTLPNVNSPCQMTLYMRLTSDSITAENEWELYLFPRVEAVTPRDVTVSGGMKCDELIMRLSRGEDVVIFGTDPFIARPTEFKISLAGRTTGNLATVIYPHPITDTFPHEGFCSWQFFGLMHRANAISLECPGVPFDPIIEVVSTHKNVVRQAALFEYQALRGRLLVCSFKFDEGDPMAAWVKKKIMEYVRSDSFSPRQELDEDGLMALCSAKTDVADNTANLAANPNDKTANRIRNNKK